MEVEVCIVLEKYNTLSRPNIPITIVRKYQMDTVHKMFASWLNEWIR